MRLLLVLTFCCLIAFAASAQLTACRMQRKMVQESGDKDEFMPRCDAKGDYAQIQCRSGWCWCAKKDGTQLNKSVKGKPDCAGKPR